MCPRERNKSFCRAARAGGNGGWYDARRDDSARQNLRVDIGEKEYFSTNCIFALGDSARNVLREPSLQLSGSRAPGPIYALTTLGTCNYPRQFYDLEATRGREEAAEQGRNRRRQTHFRFNDFHRIKLYYRASLTHRDAPIPHNLLIKRHIVSYTFQLMGHSLI